jgi:uncharacterized SAM-binding protein YcdF (DUF218 family)
MMRLFKQLGFALLTAWAAGSLVLVAAIVRYGVRDTAANADVIVVLGAGLEQDDSPTETHRVRSLHAADLWEAGAAPTIICAGGVTGRATRSEAAACAEVLTEAGIPTQAMLLEEQSINTETNVEHTLALMGDMDAGSVIVVSSRYHMLRARWLFWRQAPTLTVQLSPAAIGHLTPGEMLYSYIREWGAFHWQVIRDRLPVPHIRVPVP